jgi:hypothetical protein
VIPIAIATSMGLFIICCALAVVAAAGDPS